MHSSTSMAMRFLNSIVVGFMRISPSEMVGNSSGKPPAESTPRLTASATWRRCELQLVSSDQELAMPMTGRPSNITSLQPSAFSHERWAKPSRSFLPNQFLLRSSGPAMGRLLCFLQPEPHVHLAEQPRRGDEVLAGLLE